MLASKAGLIHRDMGGGNVMTRDNGLFSGFLLDVDYAFNWSGALELDGSEVSEEAWTAFANRYNERRSHSRLPESSREDMTVLVKVCEGRHHDPRRGADSRMSWTQQMKMTELTVGTSLSDLS